MNFGKIGMKSAVFALLLVCGGGTAFAQKTAPGGPAKTDKTEQTVVQTDEAVLKTARQLLAGYHAVPAHKELDAAFQEQARGLMMQIALDVSEFELHRQRAVAALGYWPDSAVHALYSKLLQAPETSDAMRHQVLGHLARVFGDAALAEVVAFLRHDDIQYRLTAVHALGQLDSDAAQKHLKAAAAEESNEVVLERIARFTMQVR